MLRLGAGGVVCYAAGFAETGPEGAAIEAALVEAAGARFDFSARHWSLLASVTGRDAEATNRMMADRVIAALADYRAATGEYPAALEELYQDDEHIYMTWKWKPSDGGAQ